jgi:hypothetical protein
MLGLSQTSVSDNTVSQMWQSVYLPVADQMSLMSIDITVRVEPCATSALAS